MDVLEEWKLVGKLATVTTDNASSVFKIILLLVDHLNYSSTEKFYLRDVKVRCIAHVANLPVKTTFYLVCHDI